MTRIMVSTTRRKLLIGGATTAIAVALLFLPTVSVTTASTPQPLPPQTCQALRSWPWVQGSYGLGGTNVTYNVRDEAITVDLANFSGGANQQQSHFSLGYLKVIFTNTTTGRQDLYFVSHSVSITAIITSNSTFVLDLSIGGMSYRASPFLQHAWNLPLPSLSFYRLTMYLQLDCNNNTYQAAATAQTSAASLIQSYLATKGVRF